MDDETDLAGDSCLLCWLLRRPETRSCPGHRLSERDGAVEAAEDAWRR